MSSVTIPPAIVAAPVKVVAPVTAKVELKVPDVPAKAPELVIVPSTIKFSLMFKIVESDELRVVP